MKINIEGTKENVQKVAHNMGEVAGFLAGKGKAGGALVKNKYGNAKTELEKRRLQPIFYDEVQGIITNQPFLLRVVEYDKKRADNSVCENSVGFYERIKGQNILHIYSQEAENLGISFYPSLQETLYCPNPYRENMYICIDDYFDYIKKAKVDELETIGHKLGAKHVKISFKERKVYLVSKTTKGNEKIIGSGSLDYSCSSDDFSDIKVAAEVEFVGCERAEKPEVVYFENESDINALIKMRLDTSAGNNIKSKTYTFESNSKHEMSEETAVKIDTVIKGLKCAGNGTVVSKVQAEKRTVLEYSIKF